VDEAIGYATSGQSGQNNLQGFSQSSQNNIPNNAFEMQLRTYMQTQLSNGYNIELIKSTLINRGYAPALVNKVANDLSNVNINIKHEVHVSRGTVAGIVAAIFIIGIVVFGISNMDLLKPKQSLLDISVSTNTYSYIPGEIVNYQIHVTNMGSLERFDTTIKCLIIDDAGNVVTRKEETLALETTASVNRNIQLPMNIKPGKYDIKIISDYDGKQATSSAAIEVVQSAADKKPSNYVPPIVDEPKTPGDNPSTTIIIPEKNITIIYTPPTPKSDSEKSFGEILTGVKQAAYINPESAITTCERVSSSEQKDICYSVVADTSKNKAYCDRITGNDFRDNCYMSFLINLGDVEVCDKISETSNKEFCNQLKLIQLMDVYYREGNSEKILELSKQLNPDIYGNTPEIQTYEHVYSEPITILDIVGTGEYIQDDLSENDSSENISEELV